MVRSWLLELAERALRPESGFEEIEPVVVDSGEGRWTVEEAVDRGVPAPVITVGPLRPLRLPGEGRLRPTAGRRPAQPVRRPRLHHRRRKAGRRDLRPPNERRPERTAADEVRRHRLSSRAQGKHGRSPPGAKAPPLALVVFGASGDLTARKILPALASLADHGVLADGFTVIGVARTEWTDEEFRRPRGRATPERRAQWKELVERFRYIAGEYGHPDTFDQLKTILDEADRDDRDRRATASTTWPPSPSVFGAGGRPPWPSTAAPARPRAARSPGWWWRSPSAATWTAPWPSTTTLHGAFDEDQIFRIDHYMGKETVQNVLALRFANAIFEPIWNRRYVDRSRSRWPRAGGRAPGRLLRDGRAPCATSCRTTSCRCWPSP